MPGAEDRAAAMRCTMVCELRGCGHGESGRAKGTKCGSVVFSCYILCSYEVPVEYDSSSKDKGDLVYDTG